MKKPTKNLIISKYIAISVREGYAMRSLTNTFS